MTHTPTIPGFFLATMFVVGCGPTFDPASLIDTTRVVGARIEVEGAPDRASPLPGETANITWLVTAPDDVPPLGWAFTVCTPGTTPGCDNGALAQFEGTDSPPRLAIVVPSLDVLVSATSLVVYGEICDRVDSSPTFDSQSGVPGCTGGGGTTVSLVVALQQGDDANHNPIADRAFTFDGEPWLAGADPCVTGPRVVAGTKDHVLANTTAGTDRELYTAMLGDPPVATPSRESLQISQFTTAGKLTSQFSFVEATDTSAATTASVPWEAPAVADVPADGLAVTFTFVTRDNRGGTDWTTRAACVEP
jgi:hypothetical protein